VSRELREDVQAILDGRGSPRLHPIKMDFAFTGSITCGHCGCAMVGEIRQRKYVYYHCTGYKGSARSHVRG
jgi:hypothetical protein